jgi:hypothetical protein
MDVEEFFAEYPVSRDIFAKLWEAASALGPIDSRVSKTQVALVRSKPFAWVWIPEMHLRRQSAPLVLSFSFRESRSWSRWKEIYQAAPHRFTHHLELWSPEEVDMDVRAWLREAWQGSA